jgi:hypothetical protein
MAVSGAGAGLGWLPCSRVWDMPGGITAAKSPHLPCTSRLSYRVSRSALRPQVRLPTLHPSSRGRPLGSAPKTRRSRVGRLPYSQTERSRVGCLPRGRSRRCRVGGLPCTLPFAWISRATGVARGREMHRWGRLGALYPHAQLEGRLREAPSRRWP